MVDDEERVDQGPNELVQDVVVPDLDTQQIHPPVMAPRPPLVVHNSTIRIFNQLNWRIQLWMVLMPPQVTMNSSLGGIML